MLANPYAALAAVVGIALALASAFGAGYEVRGWREDAAKLAATRAVEEARAKLSDDVRALGERVEERIAAIRVINRTINKEVEREVREKTVYQRVDCAVPESGVRLLNAARGHPGGTGAAPVDRSGAVPTPPTP